MRQQNPLPDRLLIYGVGSILVLIPFHAFITAWFASNFGYFDAVRLWKEAILVVLLLTTGVVLYNDKKLLDKFRHNKLTWLVLGFIAWMLVMTVFGLITGKTSFKAGMYGLIINTRPFLFLLVVQVAVSRVPHLRKNISKYLLIPALIVISFGLLQLILPNDFLRHFGYGPETLPTYQIVDNKQEQIGRVQSTLRGPNPLGAYIAAIIVLMVGLSIKSKNRLYWAMGTAAATIVLVASYSRSALIGVATSLIVFGFVSVTDKNRRRRLGLTAAALAVVLVVGVILLRDNDTVQNLVFHTDENSLSDQSSNEARTTALTGGLKDIYQEPLGRGVGSAGPASLRNDVGSGRLSESYFLQIGQEAGIVGLILFVSVLVAILLRLWRLRTDLFVRIAFSSLLGIVAINLVSHALADDVLAYILGALLGCVLAVRTKSEKLRYTKA